MINREKHGAVVELAGNGTPKKAVARMTGVSVGSARRILKSSDDLARTRQSIEFVHIKTGEQ
jgi:DNA invertase Pin-like site-specific DNA recombinase